ncbi:MAG: hypothetical protein HKN26_07955 [Acidimicrobiales bacterium]|nr:hypothetical protein [Acidimicrobiales bacterium]
MSGRTKVFIAAAVLAVLWLAGSFAYWVAEGRPGSPAEFRERVADTGLLVEWSNTGGRGGNGVVQTECGPVAIMISVFSDEDELWIVEPFREEIADDTIATLLACAWS